MGLEIITDGYSYTVTYKGKLTGSMMDMEDHIQQVVNDIGSGLTTQALNKFDTKGQPLQLAGINLTARHKTPKEYQTPYGMIRINRYVYQTSNGGKTYCPLDEAARIITSSTPRFAKIVSSKYVNHCAAGVKRDLETSHGRIVSRCYIQDLVETVGAMAGAVEETMDYEIPKLEDPVMTIAFSLDGTCMLMKDDGYREAMTGTIALYNEDGDRLHTIYQGAAPEYGKEAFLTKLALEIDNVKKYFTTLGGDRWRFHCITKDKAGKKKPLYLKNASDTKIRRHIKIKSAATPFDPLYKEYFEQREQERKRRKTISNVAHYAGLKIIQPC